MRLKDFLKDIKEPLTDFLSQSISVPEQITDEEFVALYESYLSENWISLLSSLSSPALGLLFRSFSKGVLEMETLFQSQQEPFAREGIIELQNKGFGILRMTVRNLKIFNKFYLCDEVLEFLSQEEKLRSFENFRESFKAIDFTVDRVQLTEVPFDIFQFYFSYGFYVPWGLLEQNFESKVVEQLKKKGSICSALLVLDSENLTETHGYLCTHLLSPYKLGGGYDFELSHPESLQTQIFNDIARLVFQIQKDGVKITKKGEMNRKNFDKLRKIISDEALLWFLLQFLKIHYYLENTEGDTYKVSENFFSFFRHSLIETYRELLKTDVYVGRIFQFFKEKSGLPLSLADILQQYFKAYSGELLEYMQTRDLRRKLVQSVELLHRVGLVDRFFGKDGMAVYRLSQLYLSAKNHHTLPHGILTVSRAFQVIVDMQKGPSPQILYLLSIFGDIASSSPTYAFQITMQTFHRAMYLGFKVQEFVDMLVLYAKTAPDEFLMQTISQWKKTYKSGFLEEGIVLWASSSILDELEHKPEYAAFIKKRLAPEYALVTKNLQVRKILEESSLFFFSSPRDGETF